jgi:hypothetical protein
MSHGRDARQQEQGFPLWGIAALPAGTALGVVLGAVAAIFLGDGLPRSIVAGVLIGAGLGVGIGLTLFAAAVVTASSRSSH